MHPRFRFRLRTLLIGVAVVGESQWASPSGSGECGAERSTISSWPGPTRSRQRIIPRRSVSMSRLTADRRRLKVWKSAGYQVMTLYTNDWGGQLTTTRQDEWNPYADRPSDPNPERDIAPFRALAGRGQTRPSVLRRPGGEVPAGAARRPWLSVPPDPPPPE